MLNNTVQGVQDCFNDLTHTLFGQHRFGLEEMFCIVKDKNECFLHYRCW